jgi:hypothetical protein
MTPEEKGALLLADHDGKDIESFGRNDWYRVYPSWADDVAYRVKPEREKVTARICLTGDGTSLHMEAEYGYDNYGKDHLYATLTFDAIDGKPDPASLKIEEVG